MIKKHLPAEWEKQEAVMIQWPHIHSDWKDRLHEVIPLFVNLVRKITENGQQVLILGPIPQTAKNPLIRNKVDMTNIRFFQVDTNDVWARDTLPLTAKKNNGFEMHHFTFNGWGMKYPSHYDNLVSHHLRKLEIFSKQVSHIDHRFVLEGGSIECDGKGTALTTSRCLLSPNRNHPLKKGQIENRLKKYFGFKRILWLNYGMIEGDDTDSHIDLLARFSDAETILYCGAEGSRSREQKVELEKMEQELQAFKTPEGKSYKLIRMPLPQVSYYDEVLPASYLNFLIINKAVIMPSFGIDQDDEAADILQSVFPKRKIIRLDSRLLFTEGGGPHCMTMQIPEGVLL